MNSTDLNRRVLQRVSLPPANGGSIAVASGHEILVTDDDGGLSEVIVARLRAAGCPARRVRIDSDIEEVGDIGGLIVVAPASGAGAALWNPATEDFLTAAFAIMRAAGPGLLRAAGSGGAILATVSRMDGAFGLIGGDFDAAQGGLAGLVKTVAREWETVACRALDVDLRWEDHAAAASAIVAEMSATGPMEVGLGAGARCGLELRSAEIAAGAPAIAEGDVVVMTGGGRGVTAESALALARRYKPTLVLLGRTSLDDAEPSWLVGLESEREIKSAIRANAFGENVKPRPRELKAAYARIMAVREIRGNLDRLASSGVRAVYYNVDVCDATAVRAIMDEVRSTLGPVRGLIHGAGAIQDGRIENKTPEQFARVLAPKVAGLRNLLGALEWEALRHVVLFSSVSGRCGNAGQSDYAAANEVLNKAARRLAVRLPSARVVSLNWGPWEGGMVTPALQAEFERRGVALIPMVAGGACVADELADASNGSIEVVLGASFEMPGLDAAGHAGVERNDSADARVAADAEMHLAFEHLLDLESHPILRSHVLDGRPVLPVAMMMEWMAHAAMHLNPGLRFQGMDELRILKGVVHNGSARPLRFYVGQPRRSGEVYDVDVSIRSAGDGGAETLHARANVVLTSRRGTAPTVEIPSDLFARAYEPGVAGAYQDVLFHGKALHGIRRVNGFSKDGMVAEAETAGKPGEWMTDPLRSDWLGDPLAIDSAFQVAILWCHEEMGAVSLPSYLGRYRQYCDRFPNDGVTVALQVRRREPHRMTGDFTFMSSGGAVVARMEGYECTVDAGLRAAFRSEGIANSE